MLVIGLCDSSKATIFPVAALVIMLPLLFMINNWNKIREIVAIIIKDFTEFFS